jgi:hypothetical protein
MDHCVPGDSPRDFARRVTQRELAQRRPGFLSPSERPVTENIMSPPVNLSPPL